MRADELFSAIEAGLDEDWMPNDAVRAAFTSFDVARESVLSENELAGERAWAPDEEVVHELVKRAKSDPQWPANAPDVRISVLRIVLQRRLQVFGTAKAAEVDGRVHVRLLRTRRLEASVMEVDDGYLILMDIALHDLVSFHAQMILAAADLPFEAIGGQPVTANLLDKSTAVRAGIATQGAIRWTGNVGLGFAIALPEPLASYHQAIIEQSELFVLAHEFAHVLLGHNSSDDARQEAIHFGPVASTAYRSDWSRELDADAFAVRLLLMEDDGAEPTAETMLLTLLTIKITLQTLEAASKSRYIQRSTSHPGAGARYEAILENLFGLYDMPAIRVADTIADFYFHGLQTVHQLVPSEESLSQLLLANPRVFFSDPVALSGIDAWEFWARILRTTATNTFLQWGIAFLGSCDVADVSAVILIAYGDTSNAQPADPLVWTRVLVALGEAWFLEVVAPQIPPNVMSGGSTDGSTYAELISALEAFRDADGILACQAVQPIAEYWRLRTTTRKQDVYLSEPDDLNQCRKIVKRFEVRSR